MATRDYTVDGAEITPRARTLERVAFNVSRILRL